MEGKTLGLHDEAGWDFQGKVMYLALRLVQEQPTNIGLDIRTKDPKNGIEGVCIAFSSREAAEAWYGPDVDTVCISSPMEKVS